VKGFDPIRELSLHIVQVCLFHQVARDDFLIGGPFCIDKTFIQPVMNTIELCFPEILSGQGKNGVCFYFIIPRFFQQQNDILSCRWQAYKQKNKPAYISHGILTEGTAFKNSTEIPGIIKLANNTRG
jgi:hypothetical protein